MRSASPLRDSSRRRRYPSTLMSSSRRSRVATAACVSSPAGAAAPGVGVAARSLGRTSTRAGSLPMPRMPDLPMLRISTSTSVSSSPSCSRAFSVASSPVLPLASTPSTRTSPSAPALGGRGRSRRRRLLLVLAVPRLASRGNPSDGRRRRRQEHLAPGLAFRPHEKVLHPDAHQVSRGPVYGQGAGPRESKPGEHEGHHPEHHVVHGLLPLVAHVPGRSHLLLHPGGGPDENR